MPIDAMGIGIILGLFVTALFAFLEFRRRHHHIDIRNNAFNMVLIFLSTSAIPPFLQLILAAILDDPGNMPSGWRTYLPAAAVAGMWFAGAHLYRIFSKVLGTTSKLGSEPDNR
ncbi:MAG: hypothetical protein KJO08_10275 [Gammaproteobacteria bacterium]|nr:hypothetical protein [Gammaproteobacteria bacterium]NNJ84845.1 hypothetical protein [Gammaproteobacteria bacterium]